jgi:hypothetical protein
MEKGRWKRNAKGKKCKSEESGQVMADFCEVAVWVHML